MEQTISKIAAEVALAFSCPERRRSSFSDRCKANARRNKFSEWRSLAGGSALRERESDGSVAFFPSRKDRGGKLGGREI